MLSHRRMRPISFACGDRFQGEITGYPNPLNAGAAFLYSGRWLCPRPSSRVSDHLGRLAVFYGSANATQTRAQAMVDELQALSIDAVFDEGLHNFLTRFIADVADLGGLIHECYLSGDVR